MKNKLGWFKALPFFWACRLLLLFFVRKIFRIPAGFTFSQGAEDIISPYLLKTERGTYVDVGCNEPVRFSNTFSFYLQGWRGVNIDANEELIDLCRKIRKKDISICAAVSDSEKEVVFHKSKESAVSTIDENRLKEWAKLWEFKDEDKKVVTTQTLTKILKEHLGDSRTVDLLSIDVEGHDFNVLKGLNLNIYRPKVIIIECHSIAGIENTEIYRYLADNNYVLKGFAVLNAYYVDNRLL